LSVGPPRDCSHSADRCRASGPKGEGPDDEESFTEEQIVGFLREGDAGVAVKDLCRKHGFSEASYYLWRSKFGGMSVSDAKRLKELETENTRLKKLLAESLLAPGVEQEPDTVRMDEAGPSHHPVAQADT
jgi:putative transposase